MEDHKNKRNFKWGKISLIIFVALVFVIVTVISAILYKAETIATKYLPQLVYEKSDKTYRIAFDSINFDFSQKQVSINNFSLTPDSTLINDTLQAKYSFETQTLSLKGISYSKLLLYRRLKIEKIKIDDPVLKMQSGQEVKFDQLNLKQLNKGDTLNLPFFSEIFTDSIFINNARLDLNLLSELDTKAPEINIELHHFKFGGIKFTEYPFPFDVSNILLNLSQFNSILPDSLHQINIEKISMSVFKSNITAQKVNLKPISDTLRFENQYTVYMPQMLIEAPNLGHIYFSDTISIELFEIEKPSIKIKFSNRISQGTPLNEIDLYQLVENRLKWVKINRFSINQADVQLIPSNNDSVAQHFQELDISFFDFYGDSSSFKNTERIFSAHEFSINMGLFTLFHVDKVHRLNISNIKASSAENKLTTGNILFEPLAKANKLSVNTNITAKCKSIGFLGVDFHEMYHHQLVPMSELLISEPSVKVSFSPNTIRQKKTKDKSLILEKTQDYLKGIYVEDTYIDKGELTYDYISDDDKKGFFHTGFDFFLSELSVDSVTFYETDKIFFADNFELKFNDIDLQLANESHLLTIDSLNLSSEGQKASIFSMKLKPNIQSSTAQNDTNNSVWFDFDFPKIELYNANLHRAFFYKELYINKFNIHNPVLNFEKFGQWKVENNIQPDSTNIYNLISDYMKSITIKQLNMIDGKLNLVQHKSNESEFALSNDFSIKMINFEINSQSNQKNDKLLFSDDIDLILKKHSFTLADNVHRIDAAEIGILSTQNRIYVKDAKLYPMILSSWFEKMPLTFFAEIPLIDINKTDIFGLLKNGEMPIDQLKIHQPKMKLLLNNQVKQNAEKENKKPVFLLKNLQLLKANKIVIENGLLEVAKYENQKSRSIAHTKINFELDKLHIANKNDKFETNYNNVMIGLADLNFDLPDNRHVFNIEHITYQQNAKNLVSKNISLKPKSETDTKQRAQYFNISVPVMQINGFDFFDYIESNELKLKSISINQPNISISDKRIDSRTKFSFYDNNWHSDLNSIFKTISIESISLNDAAINIDKTKPLKLSNIDVDLSGFIIDQNNSNQGKLFGAETVNFKISNLNGKTKNGYFAYKANQLTFNHNGDFELTNLSLEPTLSKKEFAEINRFQADYFQISPCNVKGTGLKLKNLLDEGDIFIDQLNVDFNRVAIHRDKTYPLHPSQRPKMPQQALRDLKQKLEIKKAYINFNHFKYTELEPQASDTSYVFFTEGTANISNITNINQLLLKNPLMHSTIDAKLMGIGPTNIKIDWNVYSFNNEFTFEGKVEQMPLSLLNPITEPGLKMSIREGINQKLEVNFKANGDSAIGSMRFAYNDLRISVLSNKSGKLREEKFLSFLVNSMALKSDNPKPGRILLPVRFINYRDKQRSVIGYSWKSVYAGIQATFGIKNKENEQKQAK
ncbi:MAG TPA: hypothetical protein PLS94_09030 [Prolixibacteraceae bacterium]|nr:hypothetical protein [Prolixibacteraceae bacterium]